MSRRGLTWQGLTTLSSKNYVCGHCGESISSNLGYYAADSAGRVSTFLYICHVCDFPTLISSGVQIPGAKFGRSVADVSDAKVQSLYEEARNCIAAGSFTGGVLCCRKLLMNVAVSKGAEPNLKFIQYVEFLAEKNFIPPDARDWVDHIRTKGNEATHEIALMSREDAEELVAFSEMLLKVIFEFPAAVRRRVTKPTSP